MGRGWASASAQGGMDAACLDGTTCHHDGADVCPAQGLDDWRTLWLQHIPHNEQPTQAQLPLHGVPGRWAAPG